MRRKFGGGQVCVPSRYRIRSRKVRSMQSMGARRRSHTCPPLRPFDIYAVTTDIQDLALSTRALDLE